MTADFPTEEDYRRIFATERYWLTSPRRHLMEQHLRAPNQTATASELADMMKYPTYDAVNLTYGKLAADVTERLRKLGLNWTPPSSEPAAVSMVIFERKGPEEHWRWIMRPELVAALRSLGWK
jgi:hypothetical protein